MVRAMVLSLSTEQYGRLKTSQIIVGGGVQQKVWERYCLLQGVFGIVDPGRGSAT